MDQELKSRENRLVWLLYYIDRCPGVDTRDEDFVYHYSKHAAPHRNPVLAGTRAQMVLDLLALAEHRLVLMESGEIPGDDGRPLNIHVCSLTAKGESIVQYWREGGLEASPVKPDA